MNTSLTPLALLALAIGAGAAQAMPRVEGLDRCTREAYVVWSLDGGAEMRADEAPASELIACEEIALAPEAGCEEAIASGTEDDGAAAGDVVEGGWYEAAFTGTTCDLAATFVGAMAEGILAAFESEGLDASGNVATEGPGFGDGEAAEGCGCAEDAADETAFETPGESAEWEEAEVISLDEPTLVALISVPSARMTVLASIAAARAVEAISEATCVPSPWSCETFSAACDAAASVEEAASDVSEAPGFNGETDGGWIDVEEETHTPTMLTLF